MTKRFFYTDPLAAAWMAKHFGMKFGIMHGCRVVWDCIGTLGGPWGPLTDPADIIDPISEHDRLYVHPNSLYLLEPQVGDLILKDGFADPMRIDEICGGKGGVLFHCDKEGTRIDRATDASRLTIIHRDSKAFHHPESEEV